MNPRQFGILLVLVAVLGAAGLMVYRKQGTSWHAGAPGVGQKLLVNFPINDVGGIRIRSETNNLDLVRKDTGWDVAQRGNYPANYPQIRDFLIKAAELKATQIEEVAAAQLGRLKLLPPGQGTNAGVLVEFLDPSGKTIQSLLLGKPHLRQADRRSAAEEGEAEGWPDGRYVMVGTNARTVAVISDPLGNMDVKAEPWLDKGFFKVEPVRSIALEFPDRTNSWQVTRNSETNDWELSGAKAGEQLDAAKTSGFSSALSSPSFVDVLPPDAKTPTGLDRPTVITLATFDHFTYTVNVGAKTNEDYYLTVKVAADLPADRVAGKDEPPADKDKRSKLEAKLQQEQACGNWTYLVSGWTVDALLKKRAELLAEKKEEAKPETPAAESKKD